MDMLIANLFGMLNISALLLLVSGWIDGHEFRLRGCRFFLLLYLLLFNSKTITAKESPLPALLPSGGV